MCLGTRAQSDAIRALVGGPQGDERSHVLSFSNQGSRMKLFRNQIARNALHVLSMARAGFEGSRN